VTTTSRGFCDALGIIPRVNATSGLARNGHAAVVAQCPCLGDRTDIRQLRSRCLSLTPLTEVLAVRR